MIPQWLVQPLDQAWEAMEKGKPLQIQKCGFYISHNEGCIFIRPVGLRKCDLHDMQPGDPRKDPQGAVRNS